MTKQNIGTINVKHSGEEPDPVKHDIALRHVAEQIVRAYVAEHPGAFPSLSKEVAA